MLEKFDIKSDTINLTLCLWLFFSLKGLPTNQTPSSSSSSSCATPSARSTISIAKVVNPLGTVTTITESPRESILAADEFAEEYSSGAYIHENCDESMFRPYVAVISGSIDGEDYVPQEKPEPIGQKLIVPVIDSSTLEKKNREKSRQLEMKRQQDENIAKFEQMSLLNRNDKKSSLEKSESKLAANKIDESNSTKAIEKLPLKDTKGEKIAEKTVDTETVTVKIKKKTNKALTKASEPSAEPIEIVEIKPERNVKTIIEKCSPPDINVESVKALNDKRVECEKVDEFVAPKSLKSKKKSLTESSSSKESSVEKESPPNVAAEGSKSKKKKQKKTEIQSTASSSDDAKGSSASEEVSKRAQKCEENMPDTSFLLENIENFDGAQCAEIQESLLKSSVSATLSIRKGSSQKRFEDGEASETKTTSKSNKKKKWPKEPIDIEPIALNSPNAISDDVIDFTYPEPSESVLDFDNLSFKSTIDDQISMIPLESLQNDPEWMKERTTEYDKLSDDAETGSGAQYSDCKSFQLIIDEPELYVRTSDTNSSDETEDSSQSKSTKSSEKTVDEDDEELQPLICSTTSDAAVDLSKSDALPSDANPSDSTTQPQSSEQSQPQPQKQTNPSGNNNNNNNNNNKKKFRKKRR